MSMHRHRGCSCCDVCLKKCKCGKCQRVDRGIVDEWLTKQLSLLLREFSPEDTFNCDETALFWKLLPDHTSIFKKEAIHGGRQSKERITVLVGASMTGEKLSLLVIGTPAVSPRITLDSQLHIRGLDDFRIDDYNNRHSSSDKFDIKSVE